MRKGQTKNLQCSSAAEISRNGICESASRLADGPYDSRGNSFIGQSLFDFLRFDDPEKKQHPESEKNTQGKPVHTGG